MTDTAFSKSLQKEVDPEQYLALKNLDDSSVHAVAREDIICQFAKSEVARSLEPLEMMVITRRRISDLLVKLAKATIHHVTSTEIG